MGKDQFNNLSLWQTYFRFCFFFLVRQNQNTPPSLNSRRRNKDQQKPTWTLATRECFHDGVLYEQRKFSLAAAYACLINSQKDFLVPVSSDTRSMTSFMSLSYMPAPRAPRVESCIKERRTLWRVLSILFRPQRNHVWNESRGEQYVWQRSVWFPRRYNGSGGRFCIHARQWYLSIQLLSLLSWFYFEFYRGLCKF